MIYGLNCPFRAQSSGKYYLHFQIYDRTESTHPALAKANILSKIFVDKTPAGKIKDTVLMQTILTIFVVSFDPFYFSR